MVDTYFTKPEPVKSLLINKNFSKTEYMMQYIYLNTQYQQNTHSELYFKLAIFATKHATCI